MCLKGCKGRPARNQSLGGSDVSLRKSSQSGGRGRVAARHRSLREQICCKVLQALHGQGANSAVIGLTQGHEPAGRALSHYAQNLARDSA